MRKRTKVTFAAAAGLVLALVVPTAAWAANYSVAGNLNISGSLVQYGTYRPHSVGPAGLNVTTNVVGGTGGGSAFGLRNTGNTQVTKSNNWINGGSGTNSNTGYKAFINASNLTSTIPGGNLAVNGRMSFIGGGFYNASWSGTLSQ